MPGAARLGDKSRFQMDAHACPGCPHPVVGPAISGSADVKFNFMPAVRVDDRGIHAACCGPNTWEAVQGSPNVFINYKAAHRLRDKDHHCGAPAVVTGLGANVDAMASQSPRLASQVAQLRSQGWNIQYGTAGGGSYANRSSRTIVIDSNNSGNPAAATQALSHEVGHATYTLPPQIPMGTLTRQQYIDQNVQQNLRDEGEATINNLMVRDEIMAGASLGEMIEASPDVIINEGGKAFEGPDIGVAGQNAAQYQQTWQQYQNGDIDRNTAREQIANGFGTESTSTTNENYRIYYGRAYETNWDNSHPAAH